MRSAGVRLLAELRQLHVVGFAEAAGRLPFLVRLHRRLTKLLREGEIDLVLLIDYPGFNLRIAARARDMGIPVVYYIAPQVWAWRRDRARMLARVASRILLILPFEASVHAEYGPNARFVGHPILEEPAGEGMEGLEGVDPKRPLLALFPGSRPQEVQRHAGPFSRTARTLQARIPGLQARVAIAPSISRREAAKLPFPGTRRTDALMRAATAGIVKSGTATLEAALASMPFVAAYVAHPLTFRIAKRLVRTPHVALPNILAGKRIVPEYLQRDAGSDEMTRRLEALLCEGSRARKRMIRELAAIRSLLGPADASRRVAAHVARVWEAERR